MCAQRTNRLRSREPPLGQEKPVCEGGDVGTLIEFRRLARAELSSVSEIDRTERIGLIYEQRGTELEERRGNWSSPAWDPHGHGERSVAAQRHALEQYVDAGGIALGAFSDGRLVGIGVVVPHLRPEIAQLAFLHVSQAFRALGIGRRLSDELDGIARDAVREHGALLPESRLRTHGPSTAGAL